MDQLEVRRSRDLTASLAEPFDLVIIGAGALGSALAWEASSRGLRVALFEKNDFGSGTSANSLRVVHGGLRYLQTMNVRRARASAAERSAFLRIAPHLVTPLEFVIPTLPSWKRGRMALACGLALNAFLTLDRNRGLDPQRQLPAGGVISRLELSERAIGVDLNGMNGGARWFDAVMLDPARLCLSFALGARKTGSAVCNHVEVTDVLQRDGRTRAVMARDQLSGESFEVRTTVVADCRGPWIDRQLSSLLEPNQGTTGNYVKAVNLVLSIPELSCAVGFAARDRSGKPIPAGLFFAVPSDDATVVGTWYFETKEAPDEATLSDHELDLMLTDIGRACPGWTPEASLVTAVQIGLLPKDMSRRGLVPTATESPQLIRAVTQGGPHGLWRLQTEKWTTVRRLAERALDRIGAAEGLQLRPSDTQRRRVYAADFGSLEDFSKAVNLERPRGVNPEQASRLISMYGLHARDILARARDDARLTEPVPGCPKIIGAEIDHVVEQEMPETLEDLIIRRLGLGSVRCPPAATLAFAAAVLGRHLGWKPQQIQAQIDAVVRYAGFT